MDTDSMPQDVDEEVSQEQEVLVDWAKPPSLRELKADLEEALPFHNAHKAKVERWLDNLYIRGSAELKPKSGQSRIQPKLIRKHAEWRYPALSEPFLSTDEIFDVRPVTWEDREAAFQNKLVLNHQFNAYVNKVSFIDHYVRTFVNEGTVVLRTGWHMEEQEVEEEFPIIQFQPDPSMAQVYQELEQMQASSPSQYATEVPEELKQGYEASMQAGVPLRPIVIGTETRKVRKVVKNHPTVEVCDIRNVIIDPTALGDIDKASFVIHLFETSLAALRKDGRYRNLDKVKVANHSVLAEPDYSTEEGSKNFDFQDEARKKLVVYEYWGFWDIDGSGITKPIVVAWCGDTIIRMEENPYPDKKLPFIVVANMPMARSIYGEPDGALLEDNQKIIGAITRGMIDLMAKSANSQTGMRKDMLDPANKLKWQRGEDYEYNSNVDPRLGVFQHTFPEIPASAQFMLEMQAREAESLTGAKTFSDGVTSASLGEVAAGIRGALDAASKRETSILRRLAAGIVAVGRKFIAMNAVFLSEEEVVRVTNEEFVTVKRDDLAGQFDLKLSISTAEEDISKAQELAFMLQTMGNNLPFDVTKMILADIARLRKMPDLAKKIETFEPQPDPVQQKLQELEIAKIDAEIARLQAQAALDRAKVGTEQAKTAVLQTEADLNNLDFVEQESGVKQERDLQKQGEQARAQSRMKLMEHGLKRQLQAEKTQGELIKEYIRSSTKPRVR